MVTYNWNRNRQVSSDYSVGWYGPDNINSGDSYRRIRWSWGFAGVTADTVDVGAICANPLVVGIVTTIGNGSEVPPNPVSAPFDAAPPTQRWLWWEMRQPVPVAIDHAAGIITWRDSGAQEVPDVKTQVLATGIPGGDHLDLWFSWASLTGAGWDPSGTVQIWAAHSVLSSTP